MQKAMDGSIQKACAATKAGIARDLLRIVLTNCAESPQQRKFRSLNLKREKVRLIWSAPDCRGVLEACGFRPSGDNSDRLELAMGDAGTRAATVAKEALDRLATAAEPAPEEEAAAGKEEGPVKEEAAAAAPLPIIPAKAVVELQGLRARPDLNGHLARVVALDEVTGRYRVSLIPEGEQFNIKRANLEVSSVIGNLHLGEVCILSDLIVHAGEYYSFDVLGVQTVEDLGAHDVLALVPIAERKQPAQRGVDPSHTRFTPSA